MSLGWRAGTSPAPTELKLTHYEGFRSKDSGFRIDAATSPLDPLNDDPLSLLAAVLILVAAALLAGFFTARQASRIDPMTAIRHE